MRGLRPKKEVGKTTLCKWWSSEAALIMTMFEERLNDAVEAPKAATAEKVLRVKMSHLIREFSGLFGKVVADLIAEGQADPLIRKEFMTNTFGKDGRPQPRIPTPLADYGGRHRPSSSDRSATSGFPCRTRLHPR